MDEVELKCLDGHADNNNVENGETVEVIPGNGTCSNHQSAPSATEDRPLLSPAQGAESNGDHYIVRCADVPEQKSSVLNRLKEELNKTVIWKIRVWMAVPLALVFLVLIVLLLLYLCSAKLASSVKGHQEDVDDQYDRSSFVLPLSFRGNFSLANQSSVQGSISQPESYNSLLSKKLTEVYESSHALERYFDSATVNTSRSDSVQYQLNFRMPSEPEQLTRYTLSREVVYYVLKQHLFDQDTKDPLYIEPSTLYMEVGQRN